MRFTEDFIFYRRQQVKRFTLNTNKKTLFAPLSVLLLGLLSFCLALITPSEPASAFLWGYSKERLVILGIHFLLLLITTALLLVLAKNRFNAPFFQRIYALLHDPANYDLFKNSLLFAAVFLSFAFFYVSVFVPQALSAFTGWLAFSAWVSYALYVKNIHAPQRPAHEKRGSFFPSWTGLTGRQKHVTLALLAIGLIYFCVFIPVNLKDSLTPQYLTGDEAVQYPVVMKMLAPQASLRAAFYRLFTYGEYIYGFPFYGLSAILLLPVKWIFKTGLASHTQLNMLIVRQLVCVLPSVLSAFLLTYLATRFKKWIPSLGLFLIVLTLPGMLWYITRFWHPDALNLLFVSLTLFYLDRDQLEFRENFFYAAIAIGFSIATRLFGVFFFLAIAGLLVAGVVKKSLSVRRAVLKAALFCVLMFGTIVIANPYLLNPGELGAAVKTYEKQQAQISQGIKEPDPEGVYRTGIKAWWPFMIIFYGTGGTLVALGVFALAGIFAGKQRNYRRILFAWLLVVGVYLICFVRVKSYWYLLSFLVPLYSAGLALPDIFDEQKEKWLKRPKLSTGVEVLLYLMIGGLGVYQLYRNILWIIAQRIFA